MKKYIYCKWLYIGGYLVPEWETSCNSRFNANDKVFEFHDYKFCPFCGKKIEIRKEKRAYRS